MSFKCLNFFPDGNLFDRTHFNYEQPASGHMAFRKGEVFHVVDTLYKGVVGAWQAFRVGEFLEEGEKKVAIPSSGWGLCCLDRDVFTYSTLAVMDRRVNSF
jgi:hypothetical protein